MRKFKKYLSYIRETEMHYYHSILFNLKIGLRWIFFALLIGIFVGAFSTAFAWVLHHVTEIRALHPQLLYALPIGGLLIVWIYKISGMAKDPGTNVLLSTIHGQDIDVPPFLAPVIFSATTLTHLFGGSAGREGAALQIGGSLGNSLGRLFCMNEGDRKIMVMSGMSAAFAAVFGTPLAAAIFPLEMISVGIMHYSALLPCVFSAFVASQFASNMGISPESFVIQYVPMVDTIDTMKVVILGMLCAAISVLFCVVLKAAGVIYNKNIKNPYLKILAGGLLFVFMVKLLGTMDYCGAGTVLIEEAIQGSCPSYTFLLKILLTAITLGAGFKGGEIVPAFTAGATFGCLFGNLTGFAPSLCAAIGMVSVFCGVTNCPIASMLIAFELFGFQGAGYFLIAIATTYLFSGYKGLYKEQIIVYSKYTPRYINRFSGEEHLDDQFVGSDYDDL